jgi:hypothetical protein
MESSVQSLQLVDPTHLMDPSQNSSYLSLATQNGKISFFDIKNQKIFTETQIFNSQISCLRNTSNAEVLVSSLNKEIFYGQIDSKGQREGISISCKSDCYSLDISDFMIAVGSEEGEIGNFFKFLKKSLL